MIQSHHLNIEKIKCEVQDAASHGTNNQTQHVGVGHEIGVGDGENSNDQGGDAVLQKTTE